MSRLLNTLSAFRRDRSGSVAILAVFLIPLAIFSIAALIDYSRANSVKSELDIYASTAADQGANTARAYLIKITTPTVIEISNAVAAGKAAAEAVFMQQASLVKNTSVTTIANGFINGTNIQFATQYSAVYTTFFGVTLNLSNINALGTATSQISSSNTSTTTPPSAEVLQETFLSANGSSFVNTSINTFNGWVTDSSAGLETWDVVGPSGGKVIELDVRKNNFITKRVKLNVGPYELRYWYRSRIIFTEYSPGYICGSKDSDVSFDTISDSSQYVLNSNSPYYSNDPTDRNSYYTKSATSNRTQTSRVGVYLDPAPNSLAPTSFSPTTMNLIDTCTYSLGWIQRSVKVNITQAGYYWLTFQGEGASDGGGALLSTIDFCTNVCSGTVDDPFPWAANFKLFTDDFQPNPDPAHPYGSTIGDSAIYTASTSGSLPGSWGSFDTTYRPPAWAVWPINQVDYHYGTWIELDATSSGGSNNTSNMGISKKVFLVPGYYQLTYDYKNNANTGVSGNYCGVGSTYTAALSSYMAQYNPANTTSPADTNIVGVYVDHNQLFMHPVMSSSAVNSVTNWVDPEVKLSTSTLSNLPLTNVDKCIVGWTTRTAKFKILKSNFYWITYHAEGTSDVNGGMITNLALSALGGLTANVSGAVTIPVPDPQPGSTVSNNGAYGYGFTLTTQ